MPVTLWDKGLDGLTDQFVLGEPKELIRSRIRHDDGPASIDDDHCVGRRIEQH